MMANGIRRMQKMGEIRQIQEEKNVHSPRKSLFVQNFHKFRERLFFRKGASAVDIRVFSGKILLVAAFFFSIAFFVSCSENRGSKASKMSGIVGGSERNRTVIWSSSSEFAQYIELFNKTHPNNNVVLFYKENPVDDLSLTHDETLPDIIIGSYLRSVKTSKNFKSLDYIFDRQIIPSTHFYPQLLEAGKVRRTQYLLPVSFNLPVIIFASEYRDLISNNYTLTLEQIREIASNFNQQNKQGSYTAMGFTPLSYPEFPYLVAKLRGVDFHLEKDGVAFDNQILESSISFLKDWSMTVNTSVQIEDDFAYKYLFMPEMRQVTSGRCLFSYTTSDVFFRFMNEENKEIDYRWIYQGASIPIEDSFMMMGIYKKARNVAGATEFISWFLQSENQRAILERKSKAKLDTEKFGIAGGFSAVRDVNEHILPIYYRKLLTNLPPSQMISVPPKLPAKWESYKDIVVIPYITDACHSDETPDISPYIRDWEKQMVN